MFRSPGPGRRTTSGPTTGAAVTNTASGTEADLQLVSKTVSPATAAAGETLTNVVTVRNNGPASSSNVTVADQLASLITTGGFRSATPSQGSCSPNTVTNGPTVNLSCNLGTLASGASADVTIVVRPTIATSGTRTNTVSVTSPDIGDPDRSNNTGSVTSTVTAIVDLTVGKTATPGAVAAGAPLTFVTTVTNSGPSTAQTVTMSDVLPANAAFINLLSVSGGGSCTTVPAAGAVGGSLVCGWSSITNGVQRTVSYRMRPLGTAAGGTVTNAVSVATVTPETTTANNSASTSTPVTPAQLDILINKTDSVDPVDLGQTTTYTININNSGPSYGTNVVMTDVFPSPGNAATARFSYQGGLTVNQSGACLEPALGALAGSLVCTFPGLDSGQTAVVTYRMRAETLTIAGANSGTAFNDASVRVNEPETTLANNSVTEATTARRNVVATDLSVAKTVNLAAAARGSNLVYTLTVLNNGPAASDGAQIIDTLPAGLNVVSAPGCAPAANTVTCPVGSLAVGSSLAFVVTAQIDPAYAGPPTATNTASVDAPGDTNPANNTATAVTTITVGGGVSEVPTLSTWALLALALLLGSMGYRAQRGRPR